MQELCEKVWKNSQFHDALSRLQTAWFSKEFTLGSDSEISDLEVKKLVQAAAILSCSGKSEHRKAAYRTATSVYEIFQDSKLPLGQVLRVILARLGNFPAIKTRTEVEAAIASLPMVLASEAISETEGRLLKINHQSVFLTDFQNLLWKSLQAKDRIAISAPTSAGKSFVLQNFLVSLFSDEIPRSVAYIVPTRALIAQVSNDLQKLFETDRQEAPEIVSIPVDSDTALSNRAIYVMTQERIQLALSTHKDFSADIVVVDEAQSISDGSRGVLLQWVIDDLLIRNEKAQVLFASPNISNLEIFSTLFGIDELVKFASVEPTVAQNILKIKTENATKGKVSISSWSAERGDLSAFASISLNNTIASRVDKLVHVSARLGAGRSNLIYANGAADAEKVALKLADLFFDREPTSEQLALSELSRENVHPNYALAECVKRGVAFHYSNMPTQLRQAVEHAMNDGYVDFLVCTSTLLQGVNLPAKNIFMCFPEKGRNFPLEATDFWNLSGRAGRLLKEFQGNIILVEYDKWKSKPLDGYKTRKIEPAIASDVLKSSAALLDVIGNTTSIHSKANVELETTFSRLLSDYSVGTLDATLSKIGIHSDQEYSGNLTSALKSAFESITIPTEVVRKNPSISAHKQQALFVDLLERATIGRELAIGLVPPHPREPDAYEMYVDILKLCHSVILEVDTTKGLHKFHAVMAIKWMRGLPLPQIIEDQIRRERRKAKDRVIRDTLQIIERDIRFQTVRLMGCYNSILAYVLEVSGNKDIASNIPSLPLFLEIGASDKSMISFMSLGLSRVTAMKLNELAAKKDLSPSEAREWIRTRPLESLGLSKYLLAELEAIINAE